MAFFRLAGLRFFRLDSARRLFQLADIGAPTAVLGIDGFSVTIAGVAWTPLTISLELRLEGNSTASLQLKVLTSDPRRVNYLDEVVVTDIGSGRPVFGGYADAPSVDVDGGWKYISVGCVGYSSRLHDVSLSQEEGVEVASQATPADQLGLIAGYLARDGITRGVIETGNIRSPVDCRFKPPITLIDDVRLLNRNIITINPAKELTAFRRFSAPNSFLELNRDNVLGRPEYSKTFQGYLTNLTMIGGEVLYSQALATDGATREWRLGGQNLVPVSVFNLSEAPTPAGGQGIRFRARAVAATFPEVGGTPTGAVTLIDAATSPFYNGGVDIVLTGLRTTAAGALRVETQDDISSYGHLYVLIRHDVSGEAFAYSLSGATPLSPTMLEQAISSQSWQLLFQRGQQDPTFTVLIVDSTTLGLDLSNLEYAPDFQEIEVTGIEGLTLDGADQSIGGESDAWIFDVARQHLVQRATFPAVLIAQNLVVVARGNWIVRAASGGVPQVHRTLRRSDIVDVADGQALASEIVDLYQFPTEVLTCDLDWRPNIPTSTVIGSTCTVSVELAEFAGIDAPDPDETWLITDMGLDIDLPRGVHVRLSAMRRGFQRLFREGF